MSAHVWSQLDLETAPGHVNQTIRSALDFESFSTDPQPGVASVNPKPQCAFEELTFTKSCNSRYVSHFAAFFIDPRAE